MVDLSGNSHSSSTRHWLKRSSGTFATVAVTHASDACLHLDKVLAIRRFLPLGLVESTSSLAKEELPCDEHLRDESADNTRADKMTSLGPNILLFVF